ncbi:universal stress protein [Natronorubrum thiooxidans]|uniref:Nucleotide-binding universal stress protein, UspA family n=1 Tax=Natronorubrum thiooxidans TaxID=308853 RepID=A0A1N7DJR4_9EURY|nr:universal stress protein [Natronorubrum thiooxidans]SIR75985.1 Nucleotide-binding universal stress protein, UspA family [Natronorubrum thiooxidans]
MPSSVLVPVDGSPLSMDALRHALRAFPNAEITAYHAVDLFEPDYGTDVDSAYEPMIGSDAWYRAVDAATDQLFEDVADVAADYDRSVATESDIGEPARLILEYATDEAVDHIVLGSHGRLETNRALYGSVAETVARRSPVPVTVVR